jgi:hypothetical protein
MPRRSREGSRRAGTGEPAVNPGTAGASPQGDENLDWSWRAFPAVLLRNAAPTPPLTKGGPGGVERDPEALTQERIP